MLRSRWIRPGIVTNEDLCSLGPYAYILFTGLWMMADREGRLEDRPKRIKAMVMPLWENSAVNVEDLLGKLALQGFIVRYKVMTNSYIQITGWQKHQKPNLHEAASTIPPQQNLPSVRQPESDTSEVVQPCTCNTLPCTCMHVQNALVTSYLLLDSSNPITTSIRGVEKQKQEEENGRPKRSPPGAEQPPNSSRKEPSPEDLSLMRDSLDGLAKEVHMPPPDEGTIRRILASGQGASAMEVHQTLVALYKQGRFDNIRSWGLLPIVLAQCFQAA